MYDIPDYEVGDLFNNHSEVSYNAIQVEVVNVWVDTEDTTRNYIIKCRNVFDTLKRDSAYHPQYFPWLLQDDLKLVDGFYLYKYFDKEN